MASAPNTLAFVFLALSGLSLVSAQVTGVMSYFANPTYNCASGATANTDTVVTVSHDVLKYGNSCGQCIRVTDAAGSFPDFTAQYVSSDNSFSGTDFGVAQNFGGPYAVLYNYIDCATATKLLSASSPSLSPSVDSATAPTPTPTPTAAPSDLTAVTATATTVDASPAVVATPAATTASAAATAVTTSSAADGSAAGATCTGEGTYYSQPQSPNTFYCLGRGLQGPYPGLPTVALNGVDMTDDSCGKCVVLQGTGISAAESSAAGMGTTPFPAVPNYATIDNQCPECSHCDIDYYTGYTQTKNGRYTITWNYIDCATAVQLYNAQMGASGRKLLRNNIPALRGVQA